MRIYLRRFTKAGNYDDTRYPITVLSDVWGAWRTSITNMTINLAEKHLPRWFGASMYLDETTFNDGAITALTNTAINHLVSLRAYRIPTSIFCCCCCCCSSSLLSCMFYFLASGCLLICLLPLLLNLSNLHRIIVPPGFWLWWDWK